MTRKGIGFGIFLIFVGALAFLIQLGILKASVFWVFINHIELTIPLILIVTGLNLIFRKYPYVKTLTWTGFFVVMILYGNYVENRAPETVKNISNPIVIEQLEETDKGELKLKASALKLELGSTEEKNLITGKAENLDVKQEVKYKDGNKTAVVNLDMDSKVKAGNILKSIFSTGKFPSDRKSTLNLNRDTVWDINMDLDAINSDLDFSELKVKSIDIDGDAGNFVLKVGQKYELTKVNIDADAARVLVYVPQDSGIKVKFKGDASSTDFNDLNLDKQGDSYVSKNYNKSDSRIEFNIKMDAGKFEIDSFEG